MTTPAPRIERARPEDRQAVEDFLTLCGLPLDGVGDQFERFLVVRGEGASPIAACAGIEVYGGTCVFRSLAVRPGARGAGIGRSIFRAALEEARRAGCTEAWLLTRTIEAMASRIGFEKAGRDAVPAEAGASREFAIAACASAVVMRRAL